MQPSKPIDPSAIVVITVTVALFIGALVSKGFTHDLFLEGGVFLVSAKLILMSKRHAETEHRLERQLMEIKTLIETAIRQADEVSTAKSSDGVPAS